LFEGLWIVFSGLLFEGVGAVGQAVGTRAALLLTEPERER
jgi:hypothetical protein